MRLFEKVSAQINQGVELLLIVIGVCMTSIIMVQVFYRYVLNDSLFWSEEVVRFLLVWMAFLGASAAYWRKLHPSMDMLFNYLSLPSREKVTIVIHLISMILFSFMIVSGFQFAYFIRHQIFPTLMMPKWVVFIIIPISGMILLFHCITFAIMALGGNRHGN